MSNIQNNEDKKFTLITSIMGIIIVFVVVAIISALLNRKIVLLENQKMLASQEKVVEIDVELSNSKDILIKCKTDNYDYIFNFRTDSGKIKTYNQDTSIIYDYTLILSEKDVQNINTQLKELNPNLEIITN